jgi:hypothetical protein
VTICRQGAGGKTVSGRCRQRGSFACCQLLGRRPSDLTLPPPAAAPLQHLARHFPPGLFDNGRPGRGGLAQGWELLSGKMAVTARMLQVCVDSGVGGGGIRSGACCLAGALPRARSARCGLQGWLGAALQGCSRPSLGAADPQPRQCTFWPGCRLVPQVLHTATSDRIVIVSNYTQVRGWSLAVGAAMAAAA